MRFIKDGITSSLPIHTSTQPPFKVQMGLRRLMYEATELSTTALLSPSQNGLDQD